MKKISAVLLVFMALLGACTIKNPALPQWDVTLNIPLINQKYYMRDLVDSLNIMVDVNDVMYLHSEGEISTPAFGDVSFSAFVDTPAIPVFSGLSASDSMPLTDTENNYSISYGELSSGIMQVSFDNINPATQSIRITFVELLRADYTPFVIEYDHVQGWTNHDLTGCLIGAYDANILVEEINFRIESTSSLPDNSYLGDIQVIVDAPLQFSVFQGFLPNFVLNMQDNAVQIDISYPQGMENAIQLLEATLYIQIQNRIGFECEFEGNLYAINNTTGQHRTLPILDENGDNYIIEPAVGDQPHLSEINLSNNIESLLSIMPEHMEIRDAFFTIRSANQNIGTVRNTDYIDGLYTINAPFNFILYSSRIIVNDEVEILISEENQERIRTNALFARLDIEFVNNLPFGALAELYMGATPDIDVDDPATYAFSKSLGFLSAELSNGAQLTSLELSKDELNVFTNPIVYLRWAFTFDDTITPIVITASPLDYIQLRSMMNAQLHIEGGK